MTTVSEFTNLCSAFYEGVIDTLADFLSKNGADIQGKTSTEISKLLKNSLGLQKPQVTTLQPVLPAPSPALPLALTGGGMPMGLAVTAPPAGLGTAKKPQKAKEKKSSSLFLTYEEYQDLCSKGKKICAYMPNRGDNKFKVCCSEKITNKDSEPNPLKWRCASCGKGVIEKRSGPVKGIQAPVPGFNTPLPAPLPGVVNLGATKPIATMPAALPRNLPVLPKKENPNPKPLPVILDNEEDEFNVLSVKNTPDVFFCTDEAYRNLVVVASENGDLHCIGRLVLDDDEMVTEESTLPEDWKTEKYLHEATQSDIDYLKKCRIDYQYEFA